ncbi:DUF4129 domain-containing protein [Demequina sediminicola]|uniref:DUF4129 domain-containing protein n=1 Tax=Demequina sediminicola TaxID=1095026 RepID=UPI0007804E1C|nr:DUF4129 domain-containing protein [Demequina sediminicola]
MISTAIVDPDADQAREWAEDELSKPEYQERGPSLMERLIAWIEDLFNGAGDVAAGFPLVSVLVATGVIIAIVALIVWIVVGPMRRRRAVAEHAALDPEDERTADQMRAAAHAAATRHDWDTAVIEMFRASIRSASERSLMRVVPGMTASEAARSLMLAAPDTPMASPVAQDFDRARYGSGGLSVTAWEQAQELDAAIPEHAAQAGHTA